jgi:hypothetical protein
MGGVSKDSVTTWDVCEVRYGESKYKLLFWPLSARAHNLGMMVLSRETMEASHLRIAHQGETQRTCQSNLSHLLSLMSQIH